MARENAVVDTANGPVRGSDDGLVKVWRGHSVCRRPDRRSAVARARTSRAVARGRRRDRLRPGVPATGRAADTHRPRRAARRRLPEPQRLGTLGYRRRRPETGDGVDSRRRVHLRLGEPTALRRRSVERRRRRCGRDRQLSRRRLRIPRFVLVFHPDAAIRLQSRPARRDPGPAMGARQHRRIRRRSEPGDAFRRIGRRRHRHHPADHPGRRRTVQRRDRAELARHVGVRHNTGPPGRRRVPRRTWPGAQRR